MATWFRWHSDSLDDHTLQSLPCEAYKFYSNLGSILCENDSKTGVIPCLEKIAWRLRMTPECAQELVTCLFVAGLLVKSRAGLMVKGWEKRQYISDTSTERVRKHRSMKRSETVPVTPPEQSRAETETESEQSKKEEEGTSSPAASKYAYQGEVVRLNQADYDLWKTSFSSLDLNAELVARDLWLAEQDGMVRGRWFNSTAKYLANRNMEARAKAQGPPRPESIGEAAMRVGRMMEERQDGRTIESEAIEYIGRKEICDDSGKQLSPISETRGLRLISSSTD